MTHLLVPVAQGCSVGHICIHIWIFHGVAIPLFFSLQVFLITFYFVLRLFGLLK
jgi:hypothetical protein